MSESLIQDVSDTAFMVAAYRAMETKRPDALFRDPLAARLAGKRGESIARELPRRMVFVKWMVAIRTCIIDGFIDAALAAGVDTVLNLGAGLDTRPYRMDLPRSLLWIEVDYPKIIALKDESLSDETPRCRLERISLDLADIAARRALFADIARRSANVLVLTEGVIPYLANEAVASLADDLRAQPSFRFWIADYLSSQIAKWRKGSEKKLKMQNAPFLFDPADWFAFFSEHGWTARDVRYIAEEADRLNRPVELPIVFLLWMSLWRLFTPKRRWDAFRKSSGYVLLEPAAAERGHTSLAPGA